MLVQNCKQGVMWFSLLSMVLITPASAQFRGQGFFGGNNGKPAGPFGQNPGQGQFQPMNRFPGQQGQRPLQQFMPPQGNRPQPFQNLMQSNRPILQNKGFPQQQQAQPFKFPAGQGQAQAGNKPQRPFQGGKLGQRIPGLGGQAGPGKQNGAANPLQQGGLAGNRPLLKNRPNLNPAANGGKGNPIAKALEQRKNQGAGGLPLAGKAGGRLQQQAGKPILGDKLGAARNPLLTNRPGLANPKPIRRVNNPKGFGIDLKPAQKLDQRNGPRRADHVARKFNLLQQNRPANGPKLGQGIENKLQGVLAGAIRPNDPKVIQNLRQRRGDFADRMVADGALRRFRANNATPADLDLIQQLGGITELIALSANFFSMPDVYTDAGVIDPIDDGGCVLASMLEPVQILDEGSDFFDTDDGVSTYDDFVESDGSSAEELLAGNQVSLIHPYAEEAAVDFSIDEGPHHIDPATQAAYALPRGEKGKIRFANGSGATTTYTLTAGETYEFYDKDGFWDLRKKLIDDVSQDEPRLNIAKNETAPAETKAPASKIADAAQVVPAKVEAAIAQRVEPKSESTLDANDTGDEDADHLADIPADAATVAAAAVAAVPPVVKKVAGRFAVLNPLENEVELMFQVNGEGRSLAPGKVAILNVIGAATTVAFSNGEQQALVERTVAVGKAYEFWNNDGVWDLREKEIPQQRIASNAN